MRREDNGRGPESMTNKLTRQPPDFEIFRPYPARSASQARQRSKGRPLSA